MTVVFEQVFILVAFALAGYGLSKARVIKREYSGLLSGLCVYIFLPCNVFKTFASRFTMEYLTEKYYFILVSAAILAVIVLVAHVLSGLFVKKGFQRNVYKYSLTIPNYGYMGYALAESLYGSGALLDLMMFAFPTSIYTYTAGYCMLTKRKLTPKRLLQPVIIAMLIGCVAGLAGLRLPGTIEEILGKSSACMAPVSMILTGITLSEFELRKLFANRKLYIVTALRLLVIPCMVAGVLKLLGLEQAIVPALMMYAMPCGLNTIVFPKLIGEDCEVGAGLACISSVLACVTIPICVGLFL